MNKGNKSNNESASVAQDDNTVRDKDKKNLSTSLGAPEQGAAAAAVASSAPAPQASSSVKRNVQQQKVSKNDNNNNNNSNSTNSNNKASSNGTTAAAPAASVSAKQPLSTSNEPISGGSSGGGAAVPRRPRPVILRSNNQQLLRRGQLVALATGAPISEQQVQHAQHGALAVIDCQSSYAMPISTAQVELAGAMQPAGRATAMPPKRPNYLPAHAHLRYQGSPLAPPGLSGQALAPMGPTSKPNRYSWAQMQHWHASQNAAACENGATTDTGGTGSGSGAGGGFHYHFPTPFTSAASRVLVVPNPIVNLGEHTKSRLIKIIEALKHFSEKWFSHVLLLLFLALYACLGAYIFISFEASTEQYEKQLVIDTKSRIVNESFDLAQGNSREDYLDVFKSRFEEYERLLNKLCASGMATNSMENQWTFWGALFYSMTVFTTIGYGHLTPITFAGRVATMIYAIFGIPILLMVLADLGKLLTRIIKYAFKKFRYHYNKLLGRKASVRTRKLISDHSNQYIGVAKNAFERGYATYIQPYGSRIPSAFRDASMRVSNFRHHGQQQQEQQQQQQQQEGEEEPPQASDGTVQMMTTMKREDSVGGVGEKSQQGRQPPMESSDVIVTPVTQSKPVSPKISSKASAASGKSHPLASAAAADGQTLADHNQQQLAGSGGGGNKSLHGNRSPSPFNHSTGGRRKISGSGKHHHQATSLNSDSNSSSRKQFRDSGGGSKSNSVLRSMSTSEVASGSGGEKQNKLTEVAGATDHRASLDTTTNQAPIEHTDHFGQHRHELGDLDVDDGDEYDEIDDDLDIPVSFALFLLITYMMFGAVVFSIWENWNFFDALYFVFISMSTIGFGDLVPQHPKRMIGTFAYLLFGLALTSMCINVVQEKIHATFLRAKMQIGEKMGFDLDQIMADDYYDGDSAYCDELDADQLGGSGSGAGFEEDGGSRANSVVAGQVNSQNALDQQQQQQQQQNQLSNLGNLSDAKALGQADGTNQQQQQQLLDQANVSSTAAAPPPLSKSKSKDSSSSSLKWKKRSSGGVSGNTSTDQHSVSSAKRKTSAGSKKSGRLTSPPPPPQPSNSISSQPQQQQPLQQSLTSGQGPAAIKAQVETIRMLNFPIQCQVDDSKQQSKVVPANPPSINQPIEKSIRSFCEPLRRAFQGASMNSNNNNSNTSKIMIPDGGGGGSVASLRPKLVASRSQPTSLAAFNVQDSPPSPSPEPTRGDTSLKQNRSQYPISKLGSLGATLNRANMRVLPASNGIAANGHNRRHLHHSERRPNNHTGGGGGGIGSGAGSGGFKPIGSRSLGSSRRASIGHELSQLDDIIVALSHSPPDRFGRLLGIPSPGGTSRSSRSESPMLATTAATANNFNTVGTNGIRQRAGAHSMIIRPQVKSLARTSARSPALSINSATLAGSDNNHINDDYQPYKRRNSSLSSSTATSSRADSSKNRDFINLIESEAALDELEAVKFSAV